ncbi:hypothetical protein DUNSADRAFT_6906 [Dunaliella salina]|uniref:GCN5-related N-acetyltransferase Rv2170-like domain-containing protein n=1 Tax=Dunaliella salina TaxID=3046 RepID=A0ABQ7GMD6_DUNSA|nr:hypothetical protein DUNSADRAFT_6906 [Dunaliella salina]|eukprot:KAF5835766.1 hypothetical protein DUNSADRAFT_6906 [Dunaliella salina]
MLQSVPLSELPLKPINSHDPIRMSCLLQAPRVTALVPMSGSGAPRTAACLSHQGPGTLSSSFSPFVSSLTGTSWVRPSPEQQELELWGSVAHGMAQKDLGIFKFSCVPGYAVPTFLDAFSRGFKELYLERCTRFGLRKDTENVRQLQQRQKALQEDSSAEQRLSFGPLRREDAALVNDNWSFKSAVSLDLVRELIATKITSCARLTAPEAEAGRPISWVVQQFDGSIGMAHTLAPFRRQGVGSQVIADATCRIFDACVQDEVFCFVVEGNTASDGMMKRLGFSEAATSANWLAFERLGRL